MRALAFNAFLLAAAFTCAGQDFEITAIEKDGNATRTHPYSDGVFNVEWAASPAEPLVRKLGRSGRPYPGRRRGPE